MTQDIFTTFIRDLCVYFGKEIPMGRILSEYAKTIKPVPNDKSDAFFSYLVRTNKFFPKVNELDELVHLFLGERKVEEVKNNEKCYYCMDTGMIRYSREVPELMNREYDFYARCPMCEVGNSRRILPDYNTVFPGGKGLEELKIKNLRLFKNVTHGEAEEAKKKVLAFLAAAGGTFGMGKE